MVSFSGSDPAVKSGTEGGSEGVLASRISQGNGKAAFPGAGLGCGIGVEGGMQERSAWRNCQSSVSNQHSLHDDEKNLDGMIHSHTNTHTETYLHMPALTHIHTRTRTTKEVLECQSLGSFASPGAFQKLEVVKVVVQRRQPSQLRQQVLSSSMRSMDT